MRKDPREWVIKGAEFNGDKGRVVYSTADGPVPGVNEQVTVINKNDFDEIEKDMKTFIGMIFKAPLSPSDMDVAVGIYQKYKV